MTRTIELLAEAGAAGCSIEDWNPKLSAIEPLSVATDRVAEAAAVANRYAMVLTARAENHLRGVTDVDDTLARLQAYERAGAHCLYAPLLPGIDAITRVVNGTSAPINVLLLPGGPKVVELGAVGVRRISLGSNLSRIAYGAYAAAAQRLMETGGLATSEPYLDGGLASKAFGG